MNLLILNGDRDHRPGKNPLYRGTHRSHPSHCDELPDDHEINQLFFWFLEEGGELGVVHDIQKARRFAQLWNARLMRPDHFELIDEKTPVREETFLGFDLSSGYNDSLLVAGLSPITHAIALPEPILESYQLISRKFAPQLNGNGLSETFETAKLCLRTMAALQQLSPNFFEGGDLSDFRPVALFAVGTDIP